jgi:hypothetical protein
MPHTVSGKAWMGTDDAHGDDFSQPIQYVPVIPTVEELLDLCSRHATS